MPGFSLSDNRSSVGKLSSYTKVYFFSLNSGPGVDGDDIKEGSVGRLVELANGAVMTTLADSGVALLSWAGLSFQQSTLAGDPRPFFSKSSSGF
jgi:hypothetical protein